MSRKHNAWGGQDSVCRRVAWRRALAVVVAGGLLSTLALCAKADDAEVDATTTLQAYDVASPATAVVWMRRRLTQTLALRYVKPIAETDEAGPPPSIQVHGGLRLNQDFGDTCQIGAPLCFAVIDPARRASYTPLASNGALDLPSAYLEARDLPYGLVVQAGRHFHYNAVGFTRLDGVSARVAPTAWFAAEANLGTLVRRESVAGSDAFIPDGTPRLALDSLDRDRAPYIAPPVTTWAADTSLELGEERVLRGTASYRTLIEHGDLVQRRVGVALVSQPASALRISTHGVLDTLDVALVDADLGARLGFGGWNLQASLERHVPRFDAGSIWAYFVTAPTWLATLGGARSIAPSWDASLAVRGRRTELITGLEHELGVDASTTLHDARNQLGLAGFGWASGSGPLWGGSLSASRRISLWVTLEAEVSAMRIDDPLRAAISGVSLYELAGAHFAITRESELRLVVTHAQSGPVGHRLSMLAFLHLGAWR